MGNPVSAGRVHSFLPVHFLLLLTTAVAVPWRECKPVVKQNGLNVLNCSGTDQYKLPESISDVVEVLDFNHNRFTELPMIRESQPCLQLKTLDCNDPDPDVHCRRKISFSRNEINHFHESALHNLRCLQTLDLSYNQIKHDIFDQRSFEEGVYMVETLILRGNPMGYLPDFLLVEPFIPHLRHLDLSHCQLTEIGANSVDDFEALETLNLSYNKLTSLPKVVFKGNRNLRVLDLRHNQLTHLPEKVFQDLVNLHLLELSNNLVHSFHNDAFYEDSNLHTLQLDNNRLKSIPYSAVDKLPKLQILDLSHNPIDTVKHGETVSSVTKLYLNHLHELKGLDPGAFASFPSLAYLSISHNPSLETIPPFLLAANSSALQHVHLESNKLSSLSPDAVPFRQLQVLGLTGNPWVCDYRIDWMISAKAIKPGTAKCAEPSHLDGVDIRSLDPHALQHQVSLAAISGIVGFCVLLPFVAACCCLIWKRRRHCLCCNSVSIKGRYVSVYTHDLDAEDDAQVTFDLKNNMGCLKTVSNGGADDTKPFVEMESLPLNAEKVEDDDIDEF